MATQLALPAAVWSLAVACLIAQYTVNNCRHTVHAQHAAPRACGDVSGHVVGAAPTHRSRVTRRI